MILMMNACTLDQLTSPYQTTTQQTNANYRTGNKGISMYFLDNLPPYTIYDTEKFAAMIQITNEGSTTIGGTGDKIYLSGFDPTIIQGIPTTGKQIPKIEGLTQYITQPITDIVEFSGNIKNLGFMEMERFPTTILATACYGYETIANTGICIDPDPHSPTTKEKACTAEDVYLGTQGAPIAISEIEVIPTKGMTRLRIHIQNIGTGDVFRNGPEYLQKCSPYSTGLTFDEVDYVQIGDIVVSGTNIKPTCKPLDSTGHARLTNGEATILCEIKDVKGQTPYTTPITITARYGYKEIMFKDIEIIHAD